MDQTKSYAQSELKFFVQVVGFETFFGKAHVPSWRQEVNKSMKGRSHSFDLLIRYYFALLSLCNRTDMEAGYTASVN